MRIQHNIMAMNAYRNYTNNTSALSKNLEKLSSGYKINRAGDDAAGLAISEKMRAQITGLEAAQKNVKDGISLVNTAEGAMQEIHDMLNRMVYLATQSANGTYDNEVDRANLQAEVDSLKSEINRIAESANFNGIKLLDGSMDSATKTINNQINEGFGIADWVGSMNNETAKVGTGTIVHSDSEAAKETSFAIELNNSTVNGDTGVKLTLGEGENAVTLELDGTEIVAGATADEIAAAIEKKYGADGVNFKGADGSDVKFNVKANGDRIELTQAEKPANANKVVNASMALSTEGIGMPDGETIRLNNTVPKVTRDKDNAAELAANSFAWNNGAEETDKDALNKALANGVDIRVTTKADGTAAANVDSHSVNLKALQDALGEDFELSIKTAGAGGTNLNSKLNDKGILSLDKTENDIVIDVMNKNGDIVGTLSLTMAGATGGLNNNSTTGANLNTTITIGAGNNQAMNTAPAFTVQDDGHLLKDNSTNKLFELESGLTEEQLDALNTALAAGDGTITLNASNLTADNKFQNGSKIEATLSEALTNAGYKLATAWTNASTFTEYNKDTAVAVDTTAVANNGTKNLFLLDKDGNRIATMTFDTDAINNTKVTSQASVITLTPTKFNKEQAVSDGLKETISVSLKAAQPKDANDSATDIAGINWGSNTADITWHEGDELTLTIDGKDYSFTIKNGLSQAEQDSGEFIELNTTDLGKPGIMLTQLTNALKKQMNNAAKEAAQGTESYTEYVTNGAGALTLQVNANTPGKIDVEADTIQNVYIDTTANEETPGADGAAGSTNAGGQDYNAATVTQIQGNAASSGRLASTYITAEDLAGLKDGSQMQVGDKIYTFAVGKDSKAEGENIVDLTDMEVGDKGLAGEALAELYRVTTAAGDNAMFSTGFDGTKLTFTENKEYNWGEDVDLSTHEGIAKQFGFYTDGMTTTTSGDALSLQIGDTSDDFNQLKVDIKDMHTSAMGIADINIGTQAGAQAAVDVIKNAINYVSSVRGDLGAISNRLDHTANNLSVMRENIQDAESTIRDTDVAEEMMAYTKNNILVQSAQAMLAQANQVPQGVLQLLG